MCVEQITFARHAVRGLSTLRKNWKPSPSIRRSQGVFGLLWGVNNNELCRSTAVRYGAAFLPVAGYARYTVTLLGQMSGAMAQPFYMNLPAALASLWFPQRERDIATIIASLTNPVGASRTANCRACQAHLEASLYETARVAFLSR